MRTLHYTYTQKADIPEVVMSALAKPSERVADLINVIKPLLAEGFQSNWDDLCGFEEYKILIHLREAKVNKEYVKSLCGARIVNELAKDGSGEFPYHASICCRNKGGRLYFCVSKEPCSPNWNKEQRLIQFIPLDKIDVPLIEDANGIRKMDKTILEYIQFSNRPKVNLPDYGKEPTKEQLTELINMGMPCYFRYGYAYRGAGESEITKEKALELLPKFSFGMGFYTLNMYKKFGVPVLEFNELGENDLL